MSLMLCCGQLCKALSTIALSITKLRISPSVAAAVYETGNIGPTSTGQHLDVKRTDGSYFEYGDLNNFVDVEDKDFGRVPLGKVPETGDWNSTLEEDPMVEIMGHTVAPSYS